MNPRLTILAWCLACALGGGVAVACGEPDGQAAQPEPKAAATAAWNDAIDMDGYLVVAEQASRHRADHRLSEAEFLRASREPGTIVLDARSGEKYDMLHVAGAINLSFPDIDVASLQRVLPDRDAKILIYCNNNFAEAEEPFPRKQARASLNLSTYIALYSYGYRNIWELGPQIDLADSRLPFESSANVAAP